MTTKRTIIIAAAGFAATVGSVALAAIPSSAQETCPPKTVGTASPQPCHTTTTSSTTSTPSSTPTTKPEPTTTTTAPVDPPRGTPNPPVVAVPTYTG